MTQETDYNILIQNWHELAGLNHDYFAKFTFEFLSFIAYLSTQSYTLEGQDRDVINRLKKDTDWKNEYLHKISNDTNLSGYWEKIIYELKRQPLTNTSVRPGRSVNRRQKPPIQVDDLEDWENMVEFWYMVRNNLFHGGKNPQFDRDKFLVETSYKTLSELVNIMLIQ
jgi:hypothetical protein